MAPATLESRGHLPKPPGPPEGEPAVRLRKTPAAIAASVAAAALAIAGCTSSGKNAPDITELGNTDTPTQASLGMLANITTNVNSWSNKPNVVSGMLANDTQSGTIYAVPWFGGVRGIWYRTDQFKAAGISSPPTSWADLVTDAKKL